MAQRLGLHGSHLLDTWAIIHHVENLADIAAKLPELVKQLKKPAQKDAYSLINGVHDYYLETMKAYYNADRALADKIAGQRVALVDSHKKLITSHPDLATVEFSTSLTSMASLIADISRVVIDAASSGTSPASQ